MKWETAKLGELYTVHNGLSKGGKYFGSGYPFLTFATVFNHFFLPQQLSDYVQSTEIERKNYSIRCGDVFITRTSETANELGMSCVALKDYPNATYNGFTKRMRPITKRILPKYIGYYMRMPDFRAKFQAFSQMTTRASLKNEDLLSLEIRFPNLATQRKIADILSSYDDLIENNQKQIALLEEAAQRLYKEWFVDLRFPGHEKTPITGGVPEGWTVTKIRDICQTVGGGTPSTQIAEYYNGNIYWATPTDITRTKNLFLLDTEKKITQEGLQHSSAKLLPPYTILMTSRASVGFFGLCKFEVCTNQGFISCIPNRNSLRYYLLQNLRSRIDEIRGLAGGTTYLEISKSKFRDMDIFLPHEKILQEFHRKIEDIMNLIEIKTTQASYLQEARDRLLPKLMGGEMEV